MGGVAPGVVEVGQWYQKLTILDVEAPKEITKARALSRWWRGRETALRGGDDLGGRFTPAFVIDALYTEEQCGDDLCLQCSRGVR